MARITRKKLKQDEFVSTVDRLFQKVQPYWKHAIAAIGIVLATVLLWRAVAVWSGSRAEAASAMLDEAMTTYETSLEEGGDPTAAAEKLQAVVDEYGGSDQADVARLHLARIALQQDDTEEARSLLMGLVNSRDDDALGVLAMLDLIRLRVASGEGLEVAGELQAMVTGRNSQLPRDTALYQLGEVYRAEQNPDEARTYYQTLVDEFPRSPYASLARQRLAELG